MNLLWSELIKGIKSTLKELSLVLATDLTGYFIYYKEKTVMKKKKSAYKKKCKLS